MEAYSATFMDHFEHPRNAGELPEADAVGNQTNPVCGDVMRLMLRVQGGRITEARFQTDGCPASIAASSVFTEMITGRSLAEAEALAKEDVVEALGGLPPSKLHASVLVTGALRQALGQLQRQDA
jgi:nitrogen fixation NifU-like protein